MFLRLCLHVRQPLARKKVPTARCSFAPTDLYESPWLPMCDVQVRWSNRDAAAVPLSNDQDNIRRIRSDLNRPQGRITACECITPSSERRSQMRLRLGAIGRKLRPKAIRGAIFLVALLGTARTVWSGNQCIDLYSGLCEHLGYVNRTCTVKHGFSFWTSWSDEYCAAALKFDPNQGTYHYTDRQGCVNPRASSQGDPRRCCMGCPPGFSG